MDDELSRELREAGVPTDEVPELERLARDLGWELPVQPDPGWLRASRQRLMRRFSELHEAGAAPTAERPLESSEG